MGNIALCTVLTDFELGPHSDLVHVKGCLQHLTNVFFN